MIAGIDGKILERLKELRGREGSLPESLEFFEKLLRIQAQVRTNIDTPEAISKDKIKSRLGSGLPALSFDDLELDWSLVQGILKDIIALFESYSGFLGKVPESVKELCSALDLLKETVKAWFDGRPLSTQIASNDSDSAFAGLVLLSTFKPFLINYNQAIIRLIDQETWRRRCCPVCGGSPDFSFLEKEFGARYLMCSRCDAQWLFQRMECPYCGNTEQSALAYYTDDKELYRLYTCERCRHYLKTIDLRKAQSEVLLPLERFLTFDLDTQAQENGYSPG